MVTWVAYVWVQLVPPGFVAPFERVPGTHLNVRQWYTQVSRGDECNGYAFRLTRHPCCDWAGVGGGVG